MSSFRIVELGEVFKMLDTCAPGYHVKTHDHNHCIMWNDLVFPSLPLGSHRGQAGKRPG